MRKRIKTKKLNRSSNHRKALFKNLVISLTKNEEIVTTKAKATAVRGIFEKLVTKGKVGSLHVRRLIQGMIQDKDAVKKIVDDLGVRFKDTKGGYTKITKLGNRRGDNAPMVKLSLTKKAKIVVEDKKPTKKKSPKKPSKTKTTKTKKSTKSKKESK